MTGRTGVLVAALVVAGFAGAGAQAPGGPESQNIMPALLTEVRGLRAAMEQMASAGARVQLALGRVQLQEQRLNTAIRRLEDTRVRLAQLQRSTAEQQDQLSLIESAMKEDRDGIPNAHDEREEVERMLAQQRRQIARSGQEIQQLTADETALANEVAAEQARWIAYNERLEELERSLGRR